MIDFLLLISGLVGLWIGTELIVRRASRLAQRYHLSETVIGLSILALGTDLPEFVVMFDASVRALGGADTSGIVLGSAIGSAIGQFGLAMGAAGLVGYLMMSRRYIIRHGSVLLSAIILLFVFGLDGTINRIEGIILVLVFIVYFVMLFSAPGHEKEEAPPTRAEPLYRSWIILGLGFLILIGNAELTVNAARGLADSLGMSQATISVIVIGMGSSLPELSLSVTALLRKKGGLSVGNLVGSNILDTLLIPGLAAIIIPLQVGKATLWFDLPVLFALTLLVLAFMFFSRRGLQRREAVVLVVFYAIFVLARFSGEWFEDFYQGIG